jgi:hypothetical protein
MSIETTSLALGPVRLNIAAQQAALHAAVRSAYRSFVVPAADGDQALTLHIDYASGPAPADWPFFFERGILHFTATHYNGWLNLHAPHPAQRAYLNVVAPHPFEPVDYFVRAALSLLSFETGGLLFHAAGLVRRRQGFAFFGYSGSGKTTVARNSADAVVLNDDLVMLHQAAQGWTMHATPFSNPTQVTPSAPQSASLAALYRLVQAPRVWVEPLEQALAIAEIIASSPVVSADPDRAISLLARAAQLVAAVPVQRLHFLPDDSFWSVIQP